MARTWITAGTAWAAIVALAWWLADARIEICGDHDMPCVLRATATRDNVLLWGGSIALALFVLLALAGQVRIGRLNLRWLTLGAASPSASRAAILPKRAKD